MIRIRQTLMRLYLHKRVKTRVVTMFIGFLYKENHAGKKPRNLKRLLITVYRCGSQSVYREAVKRIMIK
jgi:hypothetical protein